MYNKFNKMKTFETTLSTKLQIHGSSSEYGMDIAIFGACALVEH